MFSCLVELVFSDSLYFGEFSKNSFVYFSILTSVCPVKKHASWGFYSHCVKLQNNLEKNNIFWKLCLQNIVANVYKLWTAKNLSYRCGAHVWNALSTWLFIVTLFVIPCRTHHNLSQKANDTTGKVLTPGTEKGLTSLTYSEISVNSQEKSP